MIFHPSCFGGIRSLIKSIALKVILVAVTKCLAKVREREREDYNKFTGSEIHMKESE